MKKIIALLVLLTTLLSLVSCTKRTYSQKENNDAVTAAQKLEARRVESGCHAESYVMDLTLDTQENTVSGSTTVKLTNTSTSGLSEICFRYFAPAFDKESKINRISNSETEEEYSLTAEVDNTLIRAALPAALEPGESLSLDVDFTSCIPDVSSRYGIFSLSEKQKMYNLTFCFPQVAFLDNGIWNDEKYFASGESLYNEMSDYTVTLTAPEEYAVLSSGKAVTSGNKTVITAKNAREMAISACNFAEIYTKESDGITYNIFKYDLPINKELLDDSFDLILETVIESVELFSRDIGGYIYDELDIIPVIYDGSGIGGMEYPGLIHVTIPESNEDTGNKEDDLADDLNFLSSLAETVNITAHEAGHEWFYCAVGNDEMNESWIDESFTCYLETYFGRYSERCVTMYRDMVRKYEFNGDTEVDVFNSFKDEYDDKYKGYYINFPADEYKGGDYYYVYSYGENFLRKLEDAMGKDSFLEMLSDWYNENLGGIVEGYAFVNHVIEYDSSDGVKKLINEYISDEYLQ